MFQHRKEIDGITQKAYEALNNLQKITNPDSGEYHQTKDFGD